jgi:hypothetical protein
MKPIHRSLAGLAIAAVSLPLFLSLLACLPVPVGDPEKSRIDPELSGIWLHMAEGEIPAITFLEPYDKRSWLVTMYALSADGPGCAEDTDEDVAEDYGYWVRSFEVAAGGCYEFDDSAIYKVWQTQISGTRLTTWEPKGAFDERHGFGSEYWLVFRTGRDGPDRFVLTLINGEHDAVEEVLESADLEWIADTDPPYDPRKLRAARRQVEAAIRRNIDDEELFLEEETWTLERVRPEHYKLFLGPLDDAIPVYD